MRTVGRYTPKRSAYAPLQLMGLGWVIVLALVVGVLGGIWVDGRLGTSPLFTVIGIALGLGGAYVGARSLVRQAREM